ncbi:MAG: DUF2470 domain-containing protein [Cyanobacteria bacterium J06635_15]
MAPAKQPPEGDGAPLTDKLLTAIAQHLNRDHLDDMLACAKGAADLDWAEQVKVISLDAAGINLEVSGGGQVKTVRIEFPVPAKGVLGFQRIVGVMIAESRAKLGWAAADED